MQRKAHPLVLLCAIFMSGQVAASDLPAAIRWELPWKGTTELTYKSELTTAETRRGERQEDVAWSTETLITVPVADGFRQTWQSSDVDYYVVDGDRSLESIKRDSARSAVDLKTVVALDKAGRYVEIENIEEIAARMRVIMPPLIEAMGKAISERNGWEALDPADAKRLNEELLWDMTQPDVVEGMIALDMEMYNRFAGADFELGKVYEQMTEVPAHAGGVPVTSKLTYSLEELDEADLRVTFERAIDLDGGSVHDAGHLLVHRPTGVIEMYQATRTTRFAESEKFERQRLRLIGGEHQHEWQDESAVENDVPMS